MTTAWSFLANPGLEPAAVPTARPDALALRRLVPGWTATPLRAAPELARRWGVGEVWLKCETERYGLPSFKVVGAMWAMHRLGCARRRRDPAGTELAELGRELSGAGLSVLTASAGNWGRAVARVARRLGIPATVVVPAWTAPARIEALRGEGATVETVAADYDGAVAAAAGRVDRRTLLVADASADPDDPVTGWVTDGYETIFAEVDHALGAAGAPDLLVVPIGAGSLAAGAARHYRSVHTRLLGVEPESAACASAAVVAGRIVTVPADRPSPLAGMNVGTLSAPAWPEVSRGIDGFGRVDVAVAERGMRTLAALGIAAGACSGAAVGAAAELLRGPDRDARRTLQLSSDSRIVVLLTEGVTDPDHYAAVLASRG